MRKYIRNEDLHRTAVDLVSNLITAGKHHPEYGVFEIGRVTRPKRNDYKRESLGKTYNVTRMDCGDVWITTTITNPLGKEVELEVGIECGTDNSSSYGSDSRYSDIKDLYRVGELGCGYGTKKKSLRAPATAIGYALELLKEKYTRHQRDFDKNKRRWWACKHLSTEFNAVPKSGSSTWLPNPTVMFDAPKWMRDEWSDDGLLTDHTFNYVVKIEWNDEYMRAGHQDYTDPKFFKYSLCQQRGTDTRFDTITQVKRYIKRDIYNLYVETWGNDGMQHGFNHVDKTFDDIAFMDGDRWTGQSDREDCQEDG